MAANDKAAAGANRAALGTAFDRHNFTSKNRLHNMSPIEEGDLSAIYDCAQEVHVGRSNTQCAACRKPFNAVRKPRKAIRLYPKPLVLPICFSFDICGGCYALHQAGGADRDGMLAAVEGFCKGEEANQ